MLNKLILDAFATPLHPGDPRAEHALVAIEAGWQVRLVVEIDGAYRRIAHEHDRAAYVTSEPGFAFITTREGQPDVTLSGVVEPGPLAPGGVDEMHVLGHLPGIEATRAAAGFERFAEALAASTAMLTPEEAHAVIVEQVIDRDDEDEQPPLGLPRLDLAEHLAQHQPRRLGWINYWSDAAAAAVGLVGTPDDVFASVRRVAAGWIVQLTDEPLDLERDDHVAALRRAYERYPKVGRA